MTNCNGIQHVPARCVNRTSNWTNQTIQKKWKKNCPKKLNYWIENTNEAQKTGLVDEAHKKSSGFEYFRFFIQTDDIFDFSLCWEAALFFILCKGKIYYIVLSTFIKCDISTTMHAIGSGTKCTDSNWEKRNRLGKEREGVRIENT